MDNKIQILQIGSCSWQELYTIPEETEWNFWDGKEKEQKFDAVILDGEVSAELIPFLQKAADPYRYFYTEQCVLTDEVYRMLKDRCARKIVKIERFIETIPLRLYQGQEGYKIGVKDMEIASAFYPGAEYIGSHQIHLAVDIQGRYKEAVYLRYNIPVNVYARRAVEVWPEFVVQGDVQLRYRFRLFSEGCEADPVWEKTAEGEALEEPILITESERGFLALQIFVCGEGSVDIGPVHFRNSRMRLGQFFPGGRRHADQSRGELLSYFDPGDRRPPLVVYFAGYRTAEGFEGGGIMKSLKTPFLLLSDPRLEGGAFYTGRKDYEDRVVSVIQETLDRLQFRPEQTIFSGLSMGTYGAVYYGCHFQPGAIVIGKPLMNMGTVADNERKNRMGQFQTSLDYLLQMTGGMKEEHIKQLNQRLWSRFDRAEFDRTQFSVAYMKQDDYDPTGYEDILEHLEEKNVSVVGKGLEGRHNDNTIGIVYWFMGQLYRILREDYQREAG
ncbi:MAG: accessory Sec system protein Asp2 [Eubacteriales bacterium]|nr:accessory Sec system protein Asp2 [Eubacteriales bacterium]